MMDFFDSVQMSDARTTRDGYLVTEARVARTGIQTYLGSELGITDKNIVRVWRPESEVFKTDSLQSYAHRPLTLDHPKEVVTADTWKDVSVGQTGEEVVRDGQFVKVPLVVMDAGAIGLIKAGKRELSMGYSCDIEVVDGVTPEGEPYDAVQRNLRMNHLAIVSMARGGSQLRIGDKQPKGNQMNETVPKVRTVLVDGLPIETTDAGVAAIEKLQGDIKSLRDAASTSAAAHSRELAERDTKIAGLEKKVLSDADLDTMIADRLSLIDTARKLDPKVVTDGKSVADIRRAVVVSRLGDAAKGKDDTYIEASFDILAKDAGSVDPVRQAALLGKPHVIDSSNRSVADTAYQESLKDLNNAWMGNGKAV